MYTKKTCFKFWACQRYIFHALVTSVYSHIYKTTQVSSLLCKIVSKVSQRGSRTNERSIRYGGRSVRVWRHWLSIYFKSVLGPVSYSLCPVPGYDVGSGLTLESLELYDYLTLFQYLCCFRNVVGFWKGKLGHLYQTLKSAKDISNSCFIMFLFWSRNLSLNGYEKFITIPGFRV